MSVEPFSDAELENIEHAVAGSGAPGTCAPVWSSEDVERLIARIRALEAEMARKDAALRQAIDILQAQGFPLMADFCRAALGPWVPTHQHEDGHTLRLVMRLTSGDVVCDHRSGDSFVIEPEGFEQWYRPLTPDEARAAVEGRSSLATLDKETGR